MAISAFIRTRYINGQFWMDEAITTGIAQHPLTAIPGILRHDGSPPLFYLLLHFWIQCSARSEAATHALPLLFGLLTHPGRDVGRLEPVRPARRRCTPRSLFAFNAFLTEYAQETRMYELMGLLGILATAGVHPRVRLPPAPVPGHVRRLRGADALHARVGHRSSAPARRSR